VLLTITAMRHRMSSWTKNRNKLIIVNFRPRPIAKLTLLETKLEPKFGFTGNTAIERFMQFVKLKLYAVVWFYAKAGF